MRRLIGIILLILGALVPLAVSQHLHPTPDSIKARLTGSLVRIARQAYRFSILPKRMGGGGGSFSGYVIPDSLAGNKTDSFILLQRNPDMLEIRATTQLHPAWALSCITDRTGRIEFQNDGW